ncbi:MAG: LysM peptidoglycan-binding domain-containing M23 family metallopeptidase [Alphaproteobacteria bacterium]|nr:LysM peptidoglycan-binding domain-containing M23 family metallopeptidase [Alphaproteobacteria bacterium]
MRVFGSGAQSATSFKLVLAGVAALLLAGCSDSIERFSDNYSNPSDSDPVYTASIHKIKKPVYAQAYKAPVYQAPTYQAPAAQDAEETIVQSPIAKAPVAALPQYDYTKSYQQPKLSAQAPQPAAPAYVPPAAPKVAAVPVAPRTYAYNKPAPLAYQKPSYKAPVIAADQTADASADAAPAAPTLAKGATIKVGAGMTLYSIAKANHMTVKQLAAANGIAAPYVVAPGRTIKVPGVKQAVLPQVAAAPAVTQVKPLVQEEAAQADAAVAPAPAAANEHVVAKGDTLFSLGRQFGMSPFAIADANGLPHDKPLPLGKKLKIPAKGVVAAAKPAKVSPDVAAEDVPKGDQTIAAAKPAPLALPKQQVADNSAQASAQAPATTPSDAQLSMRWPVRGKVISGFGSKPNGMKNEGINIAVPEGTKIQAADAGVVAYAGNELKGYGNLVLIRHANGYVTAYAHAASLLVKKGDQVKRGDVIATAGQTGAVQSPQLHFEVRKGATAMDPITFLNSASASN